MLRLSLELPTSMLERWSPLLDLDFILAHKVLEDEEYARFFREREVGRAVILDNSTHEYGTPLSISLLQKAVTLTNPTYLIAPDIVTEDTPRSQYYQNIQWVLQTSRYISGTQIGSVLCGAEPIDIRHYLQMVQGRTQLMCFTFHQPNRLLWWDLFRKETEISCTYDRVHILGMSSKEELLKWVEVSEAPENSHISFSFDTSKPLKWGSQLRLLSKIDGSLRGGLVQSKHVLDMENLTEDQIQCTEENIMYLRQLCRGEAV